MRLLWESPRTSARTVSHKEKRELNEPLISWAVLLALTERKYFAIHLLRQVEQGGV